MDIKLMNYFVAIIDNHFNLSQAARQLYITQPALSLAIGEYERVTNFELFIRHKNRIIGLTPKGDLIYRHAKKILAEHELMQASLFADKEIIKEKITIGIPPFVNTVTFGTVIPRLLKKYPNIEINIVEQGALMLRDLLLQEKIDLVALLYPEGISKNLIDSYTVQESELAVFVSRQHKWKNKQSLKWEELNREKMTMFDNTFMIPRKLEKEFRKRNTNPDTILQSASWDFLLTATKYNSELFTILPIPAKDLFNVESSDYTIIPIEQPVLWRVTLCCLKEAQKSSSFNRILNLILQECNQNKP